MSTALKPKPEPREWVAQHCAMIDAISFPVRFPQDYEILCECGDAMDERDHSELMRLGSNTLTVWNFQNYHCVNCNGEEA